MEDVLAMTLAFTAEYPLVCMASHVKSMEKEDMTVFVVNTMGETANMVNQQLVVLLLIYFEYLYKGDIAMLIQLYILLRSM